MTAPRPARCLSAEIHSTSYGLRATAICHLLDNTVTCKEVSVIKNCTPLLGQIKKLLMHLPGLNTMIRRDENIWCTLCRDPKYEQLYLGWPDRTIPC